MTYPTYSDRWDATEVSLTTKIDAMLNGMVEEFEYRGITVVRSGKSIRCKNGGGRLLIRDLTTALDVEEWIEKKTTLYGDNNE